MNVEAILTTVLASSASASVVILLSKSLLKLWLDKDLEAYRSKLAAESAREIEQLRGQLARVAVEHEVRFTRLHTKRTYVIATVYAEVERLHSSLLRWNERQTVATDKAAVAARFKQEATTALERLEKFYYPRAIWLERGMCEGLHGLIKALGLLVVMLQDEADGVESVESQGKVGSSRHLANDLLQVVELVRAALDTRFRSILDLADQGTRATT